MDAKFVFVALLIGAVVLLSGCPQAGDAGRGLNAGPEVVVPGGSGVHPPCTDSDGGANYFVQGTTKGSWMTEEGGIALIATKTDFCDDHKKLAEYFCADTYNMGEARIFCPEGTECRGGACVPQGSQGCSETDMGDDALNAGTCTDSAGCENGCKDSCAGSTAVQEYYCSAGVCNAAPHGCNVSCRDAGYDSGSCATNEKGEGYCECYDEGSICSDTDGGPNFYVGGVCSDADGDMPDRCSTIDDDILIETSCQFKEGPCVKAAVQCGKSCTAKGASGGECALDDEGLGFCRCSKRCEMQPLVIELEKDTSASSFMYGGRVLYYATDTNGIADMPDITDFNFTMATTQVTNSGSAPGTKYLEKFNSLPYKTMILEPGEFDTENYALLPDANDKLCKYIAYIADNKIGGQLYLYREGNRP